MCMIYFINILLSSEEKEMNFLFRIKTLSNRTWMCPDII